MQIYLMVFAHMSDQIHGSWGSGYQYIDGQWIQMQASDNEKYQTSLRFLILLFGFTHKYN